ISPVDNPEHGSEFVFNPRLHEPGPQRVLDKTYADAGVAQGRAVLADLAGHPAVATHIATKLARHFVADEPSPELIERLAKVCRDTDGNLKETAKALVSAEEAWAPEQNKLKRPCEWVVSMVRATGLRGDPERFVRGQALLGEPLWRPSAPKGFPDDEANWIDGIGQRLDIANNFAERVAERIDPREVVDSALGPLASPETRQAVGRAESRQQALTLVFMAPEFQRRGRAVTQKGQRRPRPAVASKVAWPASARRANAAADINRQQGDHMTLDLHAPTRREALIGSGALFAWAYAPKLARAEGRDPRVLVIVLRGALDGLAMVAPVGDPDWVSLRGDRALVLDGKTPG